MSAFGSFGGFGSNNNGNNNNNNQQQNAGFGGFGSNTNTGFGQQSSGGFGSGTNNAGTGLFGSTGTGFGSSGSASFGGNKSAFGGTNNTGGGGLFGSNAATTSGSGFGFASNTNNTTSAFGAGNSGAGLFGGGNKPAFGTGTSGSGLFGGAGNSSTFGQPNASTTSVFGAPQSTALGGNVGESQGTGSVPFQAVTDKETPTSTQTNHYQSINFMAPYLKYSFEELRLADYNQGRKYGNGSGQAGAFGASNFGAFGQQNNQSSGTGFGSSTGTGLFGAAATTSSPFGATTQTAGGFGGTTNMFGGAKPGGLFGTTAAATSSQPSGGLFGTAGNSGFGSQPSTGFGGTSGGLFGGTSQQQQQKPSGFGFGGQNPTTSVGGSSFGSTTTGTGGGLFASNATGNNTGGTSIFGGQQPQASNSFGQTNISSQPFGGLGTNVAKPSPFGNTNTSNLGGTGFGSSNQNNQLQPSLSNPFASATNQTSGGAFGPKPAFGTANNTTNTGGIFGNSSFGNNPQGQQNQTGGIFGNTNQSTGVFASSSNNANQPGASSIFGNSAGNQNNQGSLFGNTTASSLYGNPQQNSLLPPPSLTASLIDSNPYGSSSIFNGLPPPPQASQGPIATPISAGHRTRKQAALPQYKLNPIMSSRLVTPQKRGFGFSYSTYGTPSSISSNASTPGGLSSSLLGSSISRGLGKSFSTSNLRQAFGGDGNSILSPGAFSANSLRHSNNGSLKRLNIDRSLRTDLFSSPAVAALPSSEKIDLSRQSSILKKQVSFDATTAGGNGNLAVQNDMGNGDIPENSATPSAQEQGYQRSPAKTNGRINSSKPTAAATEPVMEQVKGNELAIVHEDASPENVSTAPAQVRPHWDQFDPQPGDYYSKPTLDELKKIPRDRLKAVANFTIGRENCGFVVFDEPVDLSVVDLAKLFGGIAVIQLRSITIYPQSATKPPQGQGLNFPATITLGNSWPRQKDRKTPLFEKSGVKFSRHVERLRRVAGTTFVGYDKETGEWVFKVPHFTTYGLDYDDEEVEGDTLQSSVLSEFPESPTPPSRTPRYRHTPVDTANRLSPETDEASYLSSGLDDTFDFKKKPPGAFSNRPAVEEDQEMEEINDNEESFLDQRSAASPSEEGSDEPSDLLQDIDHEDNESVVYQEAEVDLVGSFPQAVANMVDFDFQPNYLRNNTPKKTLANMGDDWAQQLRQTISPRKPNRQTLRESQSLLFKDTGDVQNLGPKAKRSAGTTGNITTSIDLMKSLFGNESVGGGGGSTKPNGTVERKGVEWPYSKNPKPTDDGSSMAAQERGFHESFKPTWGPEDILVYGRPTKPGHAQRRPRATTSSDNDTNGTIVSDEGTDIKYARFQTYPDLGAEMFSRQLSRSKITILQGVPAAETQRFPLRTVALDAPQRDKHEQSIWELASILFDDYDDQITDEVPIILRSGFEDRIRKDRLSFFWSRLCQEKALDAVAAATTAEDRALAHLSMHGITEACNSLLEGKDFRLATLVSQIGGDETMRHDMAIQIQEWRRLNVLSEMTDPIRTIYELLAGNTCISGGKKGQLEDRAATFVISERFHMDWKRAFGLRLWYSILAEESLEVAVKKFSDDLVQDETTKPLPWFMEDGTESHTSTAQGEDPLWGILKLYSDFKGGSNKTNLVEIVMPQNMTPDPMNARFSFELHQALRAHLAAPNDRQASDQLTWDFATQLDAAGNWIWAMFVQLHLSSAEQRQQALQVSLARHAAEIDDTNPEKLEIITARFKIPPEWIWLAKALYARSVLQDFAKEVDYLLRAKKWEEAHKTLCRVVAPQAVIEQNYATLQRLLNSFVGRDNVRDWDLGGQVYEDFTCLQQGVSGKEKHDVLRRLLSTLPTIAANKLDPMAFDERIAMTEIGAVVAKAASEDDEIAMDGMHMLRLPLAEDGHLKHTANLSLQYYSAIMAGGK